MWWSLHHQLPHQYTHNSHETILIITTRTSTCLAEICYQCPYSCSKYQCYRSTQNTTLLSQFMRMCARSCVKGFKYKWGKPIYPQNVVNSHNGMLTATKKLQVGGSACSMHQFMGQQFGRQQTQSQKCHRWHYSKNSAPSQGSKGVCN